MKASINFKNKKVLIVGGGNQAWNKGKKMIEEGAQVTFCAPSFLEEIPVSMRMDQIYYPELLTNYFLVIACTQDFKLNHQIVVDANQQHILSASIHQDEDATFHFLREKNLEHLEIALTTKGASPAYGELILNEIEQQYHKTYHSKLTRLHAIRQYVLHHCHQENRSIFLKELVNEKDEWITFLYEAIKQQKAKVLCFHGNFFQKDIKEIHQIIKQMKIPSTVAYLKKNSEIKTIQQVQEIMHFLHLECTYEIITLYPGKISHEIEILLKNEKIHFCYLNKEELQDIMNHYDQEKTIFIFHENHYIDSKKNQIFLKDPLPNLSEYQQIVPFLLLHGKHYQDIQKKIQDMNIEVAPPLIHSSFFQEILIKKINSHEKY